MNNNMSLLGLLLVLGAAMQVAGFAPAGSLYRNTRSLSLQRHSAVQCGAVRQVNTAQFEEEIQVSLLAIKLAASTMESLKMARTTRVGLLNADPRRCLRGVVRPVPADGTPARYGC